MGDPNKGLYLVPRNYGGRILNGYYSVELKRRLVETIESYQAFEDTGSAGIIYIASWQSQDKQIWYEYTSQSFLELLDCRQSEVADVFRDCVVDRRIYKTLDMDVGIHKEVVDVVAVVAGAIVARRPELVAVEVDLDDGHLAGARVLAPHPHIVGPEARPPAGEGDRPGHGEVALDRVAAGLEVFDPVNDPEVTMSPSHA